MPNEPAGTRTQDQRINLPHGLSPADLPCRCGLDFIISPSLTWWGATRKVSEEPARRQFPADCPIRRIVTHRPCVPTALRVFQHTGRFYLGPLGPGTPIAKVRCSTN